MTPTPITDLAPYPGNARRGNVELIADSLRRLGQYRPIVANTRDAPRGKTGTVLAGNHTLQAAQSLGWTHIDVHWVDVDPDTAQRIVLVDNRANDKAGYNLEALIDLVTDLPDYDATGYTQDDVDRMLDQLAKQTLKAAGDQEPEPELDPGNTGPCPMCGRDN